MLIMTQQVCGYRVLSQAPHIVPAHATLCKIHTCLFLTLEFVVVEGTLLQLCYRVLPQQN